MMAPRKPINFKLVLWTAAILGALVVWGTGYVYLNYESLKTKVMDYGENHTDGPLERPIRLFKQALDNMAADNFSSIQFHYADLIIDPKRHEEGLIFPSTGEHYRILDEVGLNENDIQSVDLYDNPLTGSMELEIFFTEDGLLKLHQALAQFDRQYVLCAVDNSFVIASFRCDTGRFPGSLTVTGLEASKTKGIKNRIEETY